MILSLHHMSLPIPRGGEAEGSAFYAGVLGLEQVEKPAPMGTQGAWFQCPDGRQIHLVISEPFRPLEAPHPAFYVSDWEEMGQRLVQAGRAWEPDDRWPGILRAFTFDPFGNRIEILDAASRIL